MWCSGRAHEQEGGRNTYPPDDLCLVLFPQQLVGQQVLLPSHVLCVFITIGKERDLGSDRLRHAQKQGRQQYPQSQQQGRATDTCGGERSTPRACDVSGSGVRSRPLPGISSGGRGGEFNKCPEDTYLVSTCVELTTTVLNYI